MQSDQNPNTAEFGLDNLKEDSDTDAERIPLIKGSANNSRETSIEKAFEDVGGVSRFHTLMFITFALFLATGEMYNSLIMYFNKVPDLLCTMKDGSVVSCDWDTACNSED